MGLELRSVPPHPWLRSCVVSYVDGGLAPPDQSAVIRATPKGLGALILHWEGRYEANGPCVRSGALAHGFIHGQLTVPCGNHFFSGYRGFMVILRPTGIARLFGCPPSELENAMVESDGLSIGPLRGLWSRLGECADLTSRCAMVDSVLLEILRQSYVDTPALPLVEAALRAITEARGGLAVAEMAERLSTTERTLERHFHDLVGVSPKTYCEIVRFNQVVQRLQTGLDPDWQDLVWEFGYSDQSHLGREFRRFSGVTPTDYLLEVGRLDMRIGPSSPQVFDPKALIASS